MFEVVLKTAQVAAKNASTPYLDKVLAEFEQAKAAMPLGEPVDPFTLAVWSEFDTERKARVPQN